MQVMLSVYPPYGAPNEMPIYEGLPVNAGQVLMSGEYNGVLTIDLDDVIMDEPVEVSVLVRIGWDNGPTVTLEQDSHV